MRPSTIPRAVVNEALEPFLVMTANARLRRRTLTDVDVAALSDDDLSNFLREEAIRAKELDEKLQKLIAVLPVAVTVGGLVGQAIIADVGVL